MRLGTDVLVLTRWRERGEKEDEEEEERKEVWSVGMLSQTFLKKIDAKVRKVCSLTPSRYLSKSYFHSFSLSSGGPRAHGSLLSSHTQYSQQI